MPVALLLLVVGVVVGAAATLVHGLQLGLVLALVATVATVLALPPGWWARLPFAAGWLAVVLYLANPRPEGDYLVAADTRGYLLLGTGMVALAFSIVTVRPTTRRARRARPVVDTGAGADRS